jgi:N-methylhydantoinase B/oxoprolinase/acetone carboxylase alpha subunit
VKLVESGKLNEPIRDIILQNVRQPEILWGDLQSQLASLHIGAANVERLAIKLGEVRFEAATGQLLNRSEAAMRAVIGRIPDGTYEFEDHVDDDGISDTPIRIHARLTIEGDALTVDLSGCSPQVMGPSNATLSSTCSTVFYALIASADIPIAANAGCYRPVKIIAPPGLCVSAAAPAPVVHRIAIGHRLATVLFGALHQAVPERMPAAYYAVSYVVTLQTIDPELGRRVLVEIEVGGIGALPVSDGASALSFGMHNNANIPMEMIESDMPVTFLGYGLLTDTGGPGRWRGGLGLWREWRINCAMAQLSTNLDRFKFRPFGLAGGEPAAPSALYLTRDGQTQALRSKVTNMMLKSGDIIRLETSGGGGFGEARLRAREHVERDVRLGYVSAAAANRSYGHGS